MEGFLIVILSIVGLVALFIVIGTMFPKSIMTMKMAVEDMPKRCFLLGLINTIFLFAIILVFVALAESSGQELLSIIALLFILIFLTGLIFSLSSMSQVLGDRLFSNSPYIKRVVYGGGILVFACITPFLGWFLIFPYLGITGIGAFVITVFRRKTRLEPKLET